MDIPTFGKKHSLLQNNDTPERTLKAVAEDGSVPFVLIHGRLFSTANCHS
jgi:hypothetical protein